MIGDTGDFGVPTDCCHTGFFNNSDWEIKDGEFVESLDTGEMGLGLEDKGCLHEALERSKPINQKGGAHGLVCNCPKCRVIV